MYDQQNTVDQVTGLHSDGGKYLRSDTLAVQMYTDLKHRAHDKGDSGTERIVSCLMTSFPAIPEPFIPFLFRASAL